MEQLDPPVPLEHQELREPRARPAQPVHLEAADQPDHRERLEYQERLARQERPGRLEQAERLEQVVPVDHLEVLARQARAEARVPLVILVHQVPLVPLVLLERPVVRALLVRKDSSKMEPPFSLVIALGTSMINRLSFCASR